MNARSHANAKQMKKGLPTSTLCADAADASQVATRNLKLRAETLPQ